MPNRAKAPELKIVAGTDRADRQTTHTVPEIEGVPEKPDWLGDVASEIWDRHMEIYAERGQSVRGCEVALAHYCELDAACRELWQSRKEPTAAQLTQLRLYATEFYDTPASQIRRVPAEGKKGKKTPEERFKI